MVLAWNETINWVFLIRVSYEVYACLRLVERRILFTLGRIFMRVLERRVRGFLLDL